jgi:hypothetical protein
MQGNKTLNWILTINEVSITTEEATVMTCIWHQIDLPHKGVYLDVTSCRPIEITEVLEELAGSTLKIEDVGITFFETSLDVYRTTQRDIRESVIFIYTAVRTWNILYKCEVCVFNCSEFDNYICQRIQGEDLY